MLCHVSSYICLEAQNLFSSHLRSVHHLGSSGEAVLREEVDAVKARHFIFKYGNNILFHWRQTLTLWNKTNINYVRTFRTFNIMDDSFNYLNIQLPHN